MRSLSGSLFLLLLIATLPACLGFGNQQRVVVPEHIYQYAGKSNADIIDELAADEALDVLTGLHRIDASMGAVPSTDSAGDAGSTTDDAAMEEDSDKKEVPTWSVEGPRKLRVSKDNKRIVELAASGAAPTDSAIHRFPNEVRLPVLKSGHYFSTMTAIAIEEGLDPTAIPALVVGYRPQFNDWFSSNLGFAEGVGIDLVVGGALNSVGGGGDGDSDIALALGLGLTFPWSDSGALSMGAMTWREDGTAMGGGGSNTEVAMYIGISLGSFNVSPQQQ